MTRKLTPAARKSAPAVTTRVPEPKPQTPLDLDTERFAAIIDEHIADVRIKIDTVLADIREVTAAAKDTPADDEHDPEGTTVSVERANEMSMLAALEASLAALLLARVRLDEGVYGICERCGEPIPEARLEIRPEARFCVACSAAAKRR
ncbi:TraR/DksA C4-type zinc finger protein [Arthrobacter sp. Sa2BUA2]|uniref:TraR/DksA C4-type zinc finger protein n=1 Tax=Arthrobacter pullicola TaxID=2762224 RepID=A0ABR8YFL6_9MICC|nr:TraR/DksA family transcriptional regulator [Arthrobacter pullicola]MBD8043011.1 TraR/DksA C4-type zinc finger protein [Arthrobacter pullicola]